ncbi:MAG: FecR domain-containing protein [Planctomycetota bacterium]
MDDLQQRILAYLSGEATEAESLELIEWIRRSPENAKQFAEVSLLHGQLRSLLSGEQEARDAGILDSAPLSAEEPDPNVPDTLRPRWRQPVWLSLAAALLLVSLLAFSGFFDDPGGPGVADGPRSDAFAVVTQLRDVEWTRNPVAVGERLGARTLEVSSGIVHVRFDSGVDVTIEGPAEYRLGDDDETELLSGALVANVPEGAEGFRVDTPTAQVIDLGTSFGIDIGEGGAADVLVFDGEVEVVSEKGGADPRRLKEGESIRLSADGSVEASEFDARGFEKLWPISSGIVGSTASVRFVPPWPRRIRFVRSDEAVFVGTEGRPVRLAKPLRTNVSKPGEYALFSELTPDEVPAGARVQSFFLHYSPVRNTRTRAGRRVSGSITFERPVLGLIFLRDELLSSGRRFARRRLDEAGRQRELKFTGRNNGDRVGLSEDRHTVSFELTSPRQTSDLIRVIVDRTRPRRTPR